VAALLVVMLHAGVAYTLYPMPGLVWPTRDAAPSALVDGIFWWIEGFIMPLFFLISGFFAAGLYDSLGAGRFVAHRARRLLLPLLFGIVFILPADLYVWVLGWVVDGIVPPQKLRSMKFDGDLDRNLWGLAHLWFLQYLFLYCLLYVAGMRLVRTLQSAFQARQSIIQRIGTRFDEMLRSAWMPVVLAVPGAAVLWVSPEVVTGFQHGFVPFASKFLYTIPFFLAGAWLHCRRERLDRLVRNGGFCLAVSAAVFAATLPLIHRQLESERSELERAMLACAISLFAWLSVLGLLGFFLARFTRPNRGLKYVAEASFWIYLVHHPLVGLVQIDLGRTAISAELKFAAVTGTVFAFTLLTYHSLVRCTWLGALLNGRRQRRPEPAAAAGAERRQPAPQPAGSDLGRAA
jgi:peptidoglycan/LPS O-acetylase OafA/YrhL